jgi:hypothetical protein
MLSGVGALITAAVAVTAALFAWRQVREINRLNAEDKYLEYHWIAFSNPQFSAPNYDSIKSDPNLYERYQWFVTGMLMCVERILAVFPDDISWRSAVTEDVRRHREMIESPDFARTRESFYPYMRRFVSNALNSIEQGDSP